ncbi:MAG: YceI family protein [Acidimicrobiales bacterium]
MTTKTQVTARRVNGAEWPAVGHYILDPAHTELGFAVRHMAVSKVRGRLDTFDGFIDIAEDPADSKVSVTIDARSVNTRDETRDNHLRTDDFFDAQNHPTWTFESTAVTGVSPTKWQIEGDLTIRGVTRPVTIDATLEGVVQDPYGNHRVGFSASTSIDRDDFGVSFGAVMETGGMIVAKKVDIQIEAEATLQA